MIMDNLKNNRVFKVRILHLCGILNSTILFQSILVLLKRMLTCSLTFVENVSWAVGQRGGAYEACIRKIMTNSSTVRYSTVLYSTVPYLLYQLLLLVQYGTSL